MTRYQLDDLGWLQFEQLCQSLVKKHLSLGVESWGGHSDRGRDAYCNGPVQFSDGDTRSGPVAFQVKFVAAANAAGAKSTPLLRKAVTAECNEIRKRLEKKQWGPLSDYVLISNAPISATLHAELEKLLHDVVPDVRVTCWGSSDVCDLLDDSPKLRIAFPQLLGIRDFEELLSNVVNKATIERSHSAIAHAQKLAPLFVPTNDYFRSLRVLAEHSFVVLTGPPEMGKTTIARMIGLSHLSEGWDYFDCFTPSDFFQNLNPDKPQIFVADDAFGTTEYHSELALPWGIQLSKILRRLGPKRWLIWTTRPTPLKFAMRHLELQDLAEHFPKPADVEIHSSNLTRREKALILYRHAKSSDLSEDQKGFLKKYVDPILSASTFTPERIRRFVTQNVKDLHHRFSDVEPDADVVSMAVHSEIAEPTARMSKSFDLLNDEHRYLMLAMLDAGSGVTRASVVQASCDRLFGNDVETSVERLAESLDGHFIRIVSVRHGETADENALVASQYNWIHPSWRDLAINYLSSHRNLRQQFLSRCSLTGLKLALSVGGGASGERQTPLLTDDEDWQTVTDRISSFAKSCKDKELPSVFRVVSEILQVPEEEVPIGTPATRNQIGNAFLESVRARWNESDCRIEWYLLKQFFDISTAVTPIPYAPNLERTWSDTCHQLREELACLDNDVSWLMTPLVDFTNLAEVLISNEPRFARQQGIRVNFKSDMVQCLERIDRDCGGWQYSSVDSTEELESAVTELEGMGEAVHAIRELYPELGEQVDTAEEHVEQQCELVREKIHEAEQADKENEMQDRLEAEEYYHEMEELRSAKPTTRGVQTKDIERPASPPDWRGNFQEPGLNEIFDDL